MSEPEYTPPAEAELLDLLSFALDEIWRLRRAAAYEAAVTRAHHEGYKTFPKSRRAVAVSQQERMQQAARGACAKAYASISDISMRSSMNAAGGSQTLTRHDLAQELANWRRRD